MRLFHWQQTKIIKKPFLYFSVSVERWCRLRGNLLFYFKSRDHWSEPAGVIVIEDCEVQPEVNSSEATFGLGMVSNKISIVTIFEHKYFKDNFIIKLLKSSLV